MRENCRIDVVGTKLSNFGKSLVVVICAGCSNITYRQSPASSAIFLHTRLNFPENPEHLLMTRMVTSLFALLLSIILLVSGNAFLMTLLGIRLSIDSVSPDIIGWIMVCYSIGFVLGTLYVHKIIGRVGHIRAFAVFSAVAAVTALLYPVFVSDVFWAVLRVFSGFSIAGVLVVIESWFSSRATNANRGTLFSVYQIIFYISAAGGQLIVNIGDPASFLPYSLAAILLTLALIPLAMTRMEAPVIEQVQRISFFTLARESFTGVAGALIAGVLIGGFYALGRSMPRW